LLELKLPRSWKHLMSLPAKRIQEAAFSETSLDECLYYTEIGVVLKVIREALNKEK
jgi:hypothetical protein